MSNVCGFGEDLNRHSFQDAAEDREIEMARKGQNWFDWGQFQDEFMHGRYANSWDICDEYVKRETTP